MSSYLAYSNSSLSFINCSFYALSDCAYSFVSINSSCMSSLSSSRNNLDHCKFFYHSTCLWIRSSTKFENALLILFIRQYWSLKSFGISFEKSTCIGDWMSTILLIFLFSKEINSSINSVSRFFAIETLSFPYEYWAPVSYVKEVLS